MSEILLYSQLCLFDDTGTDFFTLYSKCPYNRDLRKLLTKSQNDIICRKLYEWDDKLSEIKEDVENQQRKDQVQLSTIQEVQQIFLDINIDNL